MTRCLLAGVAVLPFLFTMANAQDFSPHGRIEEFGGITTSPEADDEVYNLGFGTSLDVPFTDSFGFQIDASAASLLTPGDVTGLGTATVTVYSRNDQFGYGVFGSGIVTEGEFAGGGGLTGLYFTDNVTYFGQVEAVDIEGSSDPVIGGALGGTYFISDNTALTGLSSLGISTGTDDNVLLGLGIGAEHRFTASPFSVGAGYNLGMTVGDDNTVVHSAQLNIAYHFGTTSLKDESRNGPGFFGGLATFSTLLGF